jgi:hypothetical protein
MAYDALHMRNTIQLLALLIFHAALVVFASLQAYETDYSLTNAGDCGELVRPPAPAPAPPLTAARSRARRSGRASRASSSRSRASSSPRGS